MTENKSLIKFILNLPKDYKENGFSIIDALFLGMIGFVVVLMCIGLWRRLFL